MTDKTANEIADDVMMLLEFTSPQPAEAEQWLKAANEILAKQITSGSYWSFAPDVQDGIASGAIKFEMVSRFDALPAFVRNANLTFVCGEISEERIGRPDLAPKPS